MIVPNGAVTGKFGVPGLKAAMDMLGYYGGPPRSPLLPLPESQKPVLRGILVDRAFWRDSVPRVRCHRAHEMT